MSCPAKLLIFAGGTPDPRTFLKPAGGFPACSLVAQGARYSPGEEEVSAA